MRFAVLGPLQVVGDRAEARIGPPRHRQLLVCLLQEANRPVPADRLVERLWGARASAGSLGTLQGYVSLLRREMARCEDGGGDRLTFTGSGYQVIVSGSDFDLRRFEDLAESATTALAQGDPRGAWDLCEQALDLWRGSPLQDGPDDSVTAAEVARLEQHRLAALTCWADAGLQLGRHTSLIGELEAACSANPLHEGLWERRILALYRSGRQADALAACHAVRRLLIEEAGLEPSAGLRDLERAVLLQDQSLDLLAPPGAGTGTGTGAGTGTVRGPLAWLDGARLDAAGPVPRVRYARLGTQEIAYQTWGLQGGPTLIGLPGFAQNIELMWEEPQAARWLRALGEFCQVVHFDKLGSGLSSRGSPLSSFSDRARELEAVMDACQLEHAFVGGFSDGGTATTLFAATRPHRVDGLVLIGTTPSWVRRPDMPWAPTPEELRALARQWARSWGDGDFTISLLAPSMQDDAGYREWMARYERNSLTPAAVIDLWELNIELDVTSLLESVRAPTLVMHRRDDVIDVRSGQYLAEHIPGARLEILAGRDHLPWLGDYESVIDQIRPFISERAPRSDLSTRLATVLAVIRDGSGTSVQRGSRSALRAATARVGSTATWECPDSEDCLLTVFDSPTLAIQAGWRLLSETEAPAVRLGIHTGEIERGPGVPTGPAIDVARRLATSVPVGEVAVTGSTRDLCAGAAIRFDARDPLEVPGFGPLRTYSAEDPMTIAGR